MSRKKEAELAAARERSVQRHAEENNRRPIIYRVPDKPAPRQPYYAQSWFKVGYVTLGVPRGLTPNEVDLVEKLIELQMGVIREAAVEEQAEREAKNHVLDV